MNITVVGSFMMDMTVYAPRAPEKGETIIGSDFAISPGGKGVNQAVSAAKHGGIVNMIGKIGDDKHGLNFKDVLQKNKINSKYVFVDPKKSTGVGFITLEKGGENRIIVVPGANRTISREEILCSEEVIRKSDLIMVQLELCFSVTEQIVDLAQRYNVPVMLDPAPAMEMDQSFLSKITYLVPNQQEAAYLSGIPIHSLDDSKMAAEYLLHIGIKNVIITLGKKGSLLADETGYYHIPGYPVKQIDSVGAGDAFNGALATCIVNGKPLIEAIKYSNATGALSTLKRGAIPSIPDSNTVKRFIQEIKLKEVNVI